MNIIKKVIVISIFCIFATNLFPADESFDLKRSDCAYYSAAIGYIKQIQSYTIPGIVLIKLDKNKVINNDSYNVEVEKLFLHCEDKGFKSNYALLLTAKLTEQKVKITFRPGTTYRLTRDGLNLTSGLNKNGGEYIIVKATQIWLS